jgi:hypothetical protein
MKIAICCSLSFFEQAEKVKTELENLSHVVLMPETMTEFEKQGVSNVKSDLARLNPEDLNNWKNGRMKLHFSKINDSDAVLILNYEKNGVENYIGGNTLIEMGVAFYLNKKIYALNPLPDKISYLDELKAMMPMET